MTVHLPPSNVRPVQWQPEDFKARQNEQFIILRKYRPSSKPFADEDVLSRAEVIAKTAEDQDHLYQIVAIDLANGTSRDATDDITSVIIERWAQDGKLLTRKQRDWVAEMKTEAFANCFRLEDE